MDEIILYLWNGLLGILVLVIIILCVVGGNSTIPTSLAAAEASRRMRRLREDKSKCQCAGCERERRQLGGYQPCARKCTENISPPPKNR
ncbi:TPA: hypothetical protein ACQTWV_000388 [Enterobacter roggenkampii]